MSDKININIANKNSDTGKKSVIDIANKNSNSSNKLNINIAKTKRANSNFKNRTIKRIASKNITKNLVHLQVQETSQKVMIQNQ